MPKTRKIRYDFELGITVLTAMLRVKPDATNAELVAASKRSTAFVSRWAGTVRERLGIKATPGRRRGSAAFDCPHCGTVLSVNGGQIRGAS